jgi:hypothetical protein
MSQENVEIPPLPASFALTRAALHRVAEQIVGPARKPDNEISLRATRGGFGTPPFEHLGVERQVGVDGVELVYSVAGAETRAPLGSLAGSAELVAELLPAGTALDPEPLDLDAPAAAALAAWFELGATVLERLRSDAAATGSPTPARLWPEHFDIAIESGDEGAGWRANYGFSPGDQDHPEPYVYVGPWREVSGEPWNASGFNGAELGYAELVAAADPLQRALDFCRAGREALEQPDPS